MKTYQYYLKRIGEYGTVQQVKYPIATVVGLPRIRPQEILLFEKGEIGEVFSIEEDRVEVLIFAKEPVSIGDRLVRTKQFASVPVGVELLGSMIDPLGLPIIKSQRFEEIRKTREIDCEVAGIAARSRIKSPLHTGTSVVDLLLPLGKGQRELIIGDRKTGKTAFLLTVIKRQIQEGSLVVYAAVARRKNEIKKLREYFEKEGMTDKTVIVASSPHDSPSLIFLTPYSAMSIAEHFRDLGQDSLVIFDDLSIHAKFYREISLLSRRFPGRESYPGDIFYRHAKLLERAGNFKHEAAGEVAITALPVAETIEADLSGYIATNLMGMTDGHIFFDSEVFYKGHRPAINISLSVTRVGRQTQTSVKREINHEVTAFMANYEKMLSFSHFGAELTEKVKTILKRGERLQAFFDQDYKTIVPEEVQLILICLIWMDHLDDIANEAVDKLRDKLILDYQNGQKRKQMEQIVKGVKTFHDLLLSVGKNKEGLMGIKESN